MATMHVRTAREVPEYEIGPKELDFTNSVEITKVHFFLYYFFHFNLFIVSKLIIWYENLCQGTFHLASWRGIQVAVKRLEEELIPDEDKVWVTHGLQIGFRNSFFDALFNSVGFFFNRNAFRDELALLQKIRHPNVVQFLGAVTQSSPMMIVTEYLPKVFYLF